MAGKKLKVAKYISTENSLFTNKKAKEKGITARQLKEIESFFNKVGGVVMPNGEIKPLKIHMPEKTKNMTYDSAKGLIDILRKGLIKAEDNHSIPDKNSSENI